MVQIECFLAIIEKNMHFLKYEGIEIGHITYTRCGAELVNLLYDGMLENSDPLLLDKIVDYYKSQDYIIEQCSG